MDSLLLSSPGIQSGSRTIVRPTCSLLNFNTVEYVCVTPGSSIERASRALEGLTISVLTMSLWSLPREEGNYLGRTIPLWGARPYVDREVPCHTVWLTAPGRMAAGTVRQESAGEMTEIKVLPKPGERLGIALQKLPILATSFMSRLVVDSWGISSHTRTKLHFPSDSRKLRYGPFAHPEASWETRFLALELQQQLLRKLEESASAVIYVKINAESPESDSAV